MDAPEDNRDVKLYRASADLLPDLIRRLDGILTRLSDSKQPYDQQVWVADSNIHRLISLVSKILDESKGFVLMVNISWNLSKNGLNYLTRYYPNSSLCL